MPEQNVQLDGLCYVAWNTNTNTYKVGDVGNHTLRLVRDGIEIIPTNAPAEVDATNAPGLYKLSLTATEMSGNVIVLAGKSSTSGVVLIPTQVITQSGNSIIPVQRSGGRIWTDAQLDQWATDAIEQIGTRINCIFVRECIATQSGKSCYTLPSYVRGVRRVTWRGKGLTNLSWDEFCILTPATAVLAPDSPANRESSISRPLYYAFHPTNPYDIRFYPTPDESFTTLGEPNPYAPQYNTPSCIIDFWRSPDTTSTVAAISLPPYILRRTQKAYVGWRAFEAETKGQDLRAAQFYRTKFDFLIEYFRMINGGCFVGKRYALGDGTQTNQNMRYPKPVLPTNFEMEIYT